MPDTPFFCKPAFPRMFLNDPPSESLHVLCNGGSSANLSIGVFSTGFNLCGFLEICKAPYRLLAF